MIKLFRALAGMLSAGILALLFVILYAQYTLPDNLYIASGEQAQEVQYNISGVLSRQINFDQNSNGNYNIDVKLFNSVPVKQVQVQVVDRKMVVPGGFPFGIKLSTEGVMVVGMSDIQNGTKNLSPAKDAGIKIGDVLLTINDQPIERNNDVADCISKSEGNEVKVTLVRESQEMELYLKPVKSEFDEGYKAGIWVRDSSAGIGTLTYYHPDSLSFAGLGHAVCDVDTGTLMPLSSGEIVDVNISGANAGHSGKPGELKGSFVGTDAIGTLVLNSDTGIYGYLKYDPELQDAIPMALKQEIKPGSATILTTMSGNKPQSFDIEIEKVNYSDTTTTKNMVIRIVDPDLLATTGGIVQGMSGSPIIQDGRMVGAVTHVFVNDPTRGYGIFAENMEKALKDVETAQNAA